MKSKTSLIIVALFLCLLVAFNYFKIMFNFTPSMPYGFYVKSNDETIKIGDYISLCLNKETQELGLRQGYLEHGNECNGSVALIKKVIAVPFQSVILDNKYISVSGLNINAATSSIDSQGRKLKSYPRGIYKLNCYWVLGDYDVKHSWDSRYWGCINKDQIITKVKPLLTF